LLQGAGLEPPRQRSAAARHGWTPTIRLAKRQTLGRLAFGAASAGVLVAGNRAGSAIALVFEQRPHKIPYVHEASGRTLRFQQGVGCLSNCSTNDRLAAKVSSRALLEPEWSCAPTAAGNAGSPRQPKPVRDRLSAITPGVSSAKTLPKLSHSAERCRKLASKRKMCLAGSRPPYLRYYSVEMNKIGIPL
jgi:hypothetical protein